MCARDVKIEAPELRLDPEQAVLALDWDRVFGIRGPVEIEIGIGKGRFLLAAATARPEVLYLGVEWANKYLRFAEARAAKRGLTNVRFARVDAKEMVHRAVPSQSVSAYYVFYPDPWPKKRHNKRRFLRLETVHHLARTLLPGGCVHVATDHVDYWTEIEPLLDGYPAFDRLPDFGGPEFPLPASLPLTNYEEKYLQEGRRRFRGSWQLNRTPLAVTEAEPAPPVEFRQGGGYTSPRRGSAGPERTKVEFDTGE
jgi:tRNA (guanine-N7-)-methyltransferase